MEEQTPKRSGGRAARNAKRAAPPKVNPAPPGQIGGQYKPLTEAEIKAVYATALRLLAELGMGEVPERLAKVFLDHGATQNEAGRVMFPNALVEDAIARASKTFIFHGRDDNRSIEVGGDKVYFGTGGAAVQTTILRDCKTR